MRILKYMIFLVAVLAFMVFMGHKETLSPEETLVIAEFENFSEQEQTTPPVIASEIPPTPPLPATTTPPVITQTPQTPTTTPTPFVPSLPNGTVIEDSVNVRSGPGLDFPVVTQLYMDDQVFLGELVNEWYQLTIEGRKLYINAEFVIKTPTQ